MAEGFDRQLEALKDFLRRWAENGHREVQPLLDWQFLGRSKYFRPVTVFACHQATRDEPIGDPTIRAAAAIEMVHNVSLIVDDILDRSRYRRGVLTLHCRFGLLPALMTSGYNTAEAYEIVDRNPFAVRRLSELYRR
jgi:geranylgeranyl diphosphate synthase type I